jgi:hypothetical protein
LENTLEVSVLIAGRPAGPQNCFAPFALDRQYRRHRGGVAAFDTALVVRSSALTTATISRSDLHFKRHDGHAVTAGDFVQDVQETAETPVSLNRHNRYVPERGGVANRFNLEKARKRIEGNHRSRTHICR